MMIHKIKTNTNLEFVARDLKNRCFRILRDSKNDIENVAISDIEDVSSWEIIPFKNENDDILDLYDFKNWEEFRSAGFQIIESELMVNKNIYYPAEDEYFNPNYLEDDYEKSYNLSSREFLEEMEFSLKYYQEYINSNNEEFNKMIDEFSDLFFNASEQFEINGCIESELKEKIVDLEAELHYVAFFYKTPQVSKIIFDEKNIENYFKWCKNHSEEFEFIKDKFEFNDFTQNIIASVDADDIKCYSIDTQLEKLAEMFFQLGFVMGANSK